MLSLDLSWCLSKLAFSLHESIQWFLNRITKVSHSCESIHYTYESIHVWIVSIICESYHKTLWLYL